MIGLYLAAAFLSVFKLSQFIVAVFITSYFFIFFKSVTMNIYVGNLSWEVTEDELRQLFEQYGTVSSVKVIRDRETGRSKGFGFIEMTDDTEGQNALSSLYDFEFRERKLKLNEAQPKTDGPRQGGFNRGGGGGYNRGGGGGGYNRGGSGGGGGYNRGGGGGGYNRGGGGGSYNRSERSSNRNDFDNQY
jgi:RNA recognition motif-containing protein